MEQYTIQLRKLIENDVDIFNFNFSLYSEDIKEDFKLQFIEHFYFSEIGFETVEMFKRKLKSKIKAIAPYYEKIIMSLELEQRILDNYDVTEEYEKSISSEGTTDSTTNATTNTDSSQKQGVSSRPMTKSSLTDLGYLDSLTEVTDSGDSISNSTSRGLTQGISTETFKYRKQGNIGIQTDADAIIKYWQSLRKIFLEMFEDCNDLFMLIY